MITARYTLSISFPLSFARFGDERGPCVSDGTLLVWAMESVHFIIALRRLSESYDRRAEAASLGWGVGPV
jgi:hypothetical protein